MYKQFLLIFLFVCTIFFASSQNSHALTLNEIEPSQYRQLFAELKSQYIQTPANEIFAIPEAERPGTSDIEDLEQLIASIESNCSLILKHPSNFHLQKNITKITSKLKRIESLSEATIAMEDEVNNYLTKCFEENDYQASLNSIDTFIAQNSVNPEITNILNNSMRCDSAKAQTFLRDQTRQNTMYETSRRYMDQSVNTYNEKSLRYNELEDNIKKISDTNTELGGRVELIVQRLNFLNTKMESEQQELNLINNELKRDYLALSQQQTSDITGIQLILENNPQDIAISLDRKHTWYAFEDHKELFKFLKLLKASNKEVRLIQGKALTMLEKKDSLSELFAEKLANTMVLDLTSTEIEKNSTLIGQYNTEQQQIKSRLDQYKEIAEQRRTKDQSLRNDLGKITSVVETCSEHLLEDFTTATEGLDKLNEDVLHEFERQYVEEFSQNEFNESKNPQGIVTSNPIRLGRITANYKVVLPRFTSCRSGDQLSIKTNFETIKTATVKGVDHINVFVNNTENQTNLISGIEESYQTKKPLEQSGIDHFMSYLNQELSTRPETLETLTTDSEFAVSPNIWSQDINTIKNTYKLYECQDSDWIEISSTTNLTLELTRCQNQHMEPIVFPAHTEATTIQQNLITELNNIVTNNQINVYGSCNQQPLN